MTGFVIFELVSIGKSILVGLFILIMVVPLPAMMLNSSLHFLYQRIMNRMRYRRVKRCFIDIANIDIDQLKMKYFDRNSEELHDMIKTFREMETQEFW